MHPISLGNTEFEGKNNAYLLEGDGEIALIDTATATKTTRDQLAAGLAERGYGFDDVATVVLTHWHPDHAGLAGDIQRESGATLYVHEADATLVRRDPDALKAFRDRQLRQFSEWGIPDSKLEELLERLDGNDEIYGRSPEIETIRGGEVLEVAGYRLRVVHAPGHTAGLCSFAFEDCERAGEVLTGDALLPVYTPNVGGADVRLDEPLADYLETLRDIGDSDFDRAWPGHRDVIDDPTDRAREIVDHHEERTERVLSVLDRIGPADPWTVSAELFGSLKGVHIMHGPGEAYAHLNHLANRGVLRREGDAYALPDDVSAADVSDGALERKEND